MLVLNLVSVQSHCWFYTSTSSGVRAFVTKPVATNLQYVGGAAAILGLVAMASDVEGLYAAVKALVCVVKSNPLASKEMERIKGYQVRHDSVEVAVWKCIIPKFNAYKFHKIQVFFLSQCKEMLMIFSFSRNGVILKCSKIFTHFSDSVSQLLAMLLKKKRSLLNSHILHLTFSLVGTVDSGHETAIIPNSTAFQDLLCDFEVKAWGGGLYSYFLEPEILIRQ